MAQQPFSTITTSNQDLNRVQANITNALNGIVSTMGANTYNGNVPTGGLVLFMGPTYSSGTTPNDPPGFLMIIPGRYVSKSTYAALFAVIGPACGSKDSANFYLPNAPGYFPRFVDNGAGIDPYASTRTAQNPGGNTGDAVGSVQPFLNNLTTSPNAVSVGTSGTGFGVSNLDLRPANMYFNLIIKT